MKTKTRRYTVRFENVNGKIYTEKFDAASPADAIDEAYDSYSVANIIWIKDSSGERVG